MYPMHIHIRVNLGLKFQHYLYHTVRPQMLVCIRVETVCTVDIVWRTKLKGYGRAWMGQRVMKIVLDYMHGTGGNDFVG